MKSGIVCGIEYLRRTSVANASAKRPSVVLLHGIGSNASSWKRCIDAIGGEQDVVAWNAPGYGASQNLVVPRPNPSDYAASLVAMMEALGLGPSVIVGHSLGALFAARLTRERPDLVVGLCLLSPASGYAVPPGSPLPEKVHSRIDDLREMGAERFAQLRAPRLVHEPERKAETLAAVTRAMAAVQLAGYTRAVWALGAGDLVADARNIDVPAIVAVGENDVVTPPDGAATISLALARSLGLRRLASTGHALPQEAPTEAAAIIRELMEDVVT